MSEHTAETSRVELEVLDPDAMNELGVQLGRALKAGDLVILTGPLGAGKTTLTRGIGEGLGVRGPVQSPTFVLARTHPSLVGGAPLVHVDAYRLADAAELDDLDLDYERSVVVAEWGAGLVDERDAWLEISLERPTGAKMPDPATNLGAVDSDVGTDSSVVRASVDVDFAEEREGDEVDAEEDAAEIDWSESIVEPRRVSIVGYGTRWATGALS